MKRFKNILVGVDLSWGDRAVAEELSEPNAEAVRQALWLAKLNSASVHFLFSLELSSKTQQLISQSSDTESSVIDEAEDRLSKMVAEVRAQGIAAEGQVVVGKSWVEMIQQVLRNRHDLVLVGTRHLGALQGFLLGSTAIKLLRKCPCAVWVTQPRPNQECKSILIAHDMRPVGDMALDLGASMAELQNAQLHVLHAAEFPEFDYILPSRIPTADEREEFRSEFEGHVKQQLQRTDISLPAKTHFAIEPPDFAILNCVKQYDVDLLVMGTLGRSGVSGFITGNTAEKLLPQIPCSLLAIKPPGFQSPVTLDET